MSESVVQNEPSSAAPGAPAQPPQQTAQMPPAAAPAAPSPPPPAPSQDDLKPDTVIEYTAKDGSKRYATIRDLVERAESEGARLSAEELERLKTIERGLSGDQEAARKMLEMFVPGISSQQKPNEPPDPIASLRQEIQDMMRPAIELAKQVEEQRMTAGCAALVEQWKEKVPFLAKHPDAGALVYRRVEAENAQIRASGQDPARLPYDEQLKIIARAMRSADNEIRSIASLFGVADVGPPKPKAQNIQVTNDQNHPGVEPGVIPSRFYVDPNTGMLVDRHGAPVIQTPHGATIPGEVPNPSAAGGHVAGTVPPAKQPMTRDEAMALMRARVAEMNVQ